MCLFVCLQEMLGTAIRWGLDKGTGGTEVRRELFHYGNLFVSFRFGSHMNRSSWGTFS